MIDFSLTEGQEMLRKMSREFIANECPKSFVRQMEEDSKGYTKELWQKIAELGWLGLVFPEKYGGGDGSFLDLAVLLEELGRGCFPGPFFPTVVLGGLTILEAGSEEQKKAFLPKIAAGEAIFTLALTEPEASYEPSSIKVNASQKGKDYVISGTKLFVPDAHVADYIICAARTGKGATPEEGITLFVVPGKAAGLTTSLLKTIAMDKLCRVDFDGVKVGRQDILGEEGKGWGVIGKVLQKAIIGKCCEMVGGAQQVLEMTVAYAKERVQFGRPIGSFQVIQHYCANMLADVEGSRSITYMAAWMLNEGLPCVREVSIAKAWTGEAYRRVCALSHQIHGSIGFTRDHDLTLYTRRAKAAEVTYGDANFHYDVVAQAIGL